MKGHSEAGYRVIVEAESALDTRPLFFNVGELHG